MSPKTPLILLICLLAASAAGAQQVEITPFVGFQFGGWLTDDHGFSFDELDIEESESFGLIADFAINRHAQIELLYSLQETELELLGFRRLRRSFDLDIEYFHVGFLWQWLPTEEIRPFVVGSLGAVNLNLEGGEDETRFSISFGGGVKLLFNDHTGVRFEGRFYNSFIEDDEEVFCNPDFCFAYEDTNLLFQFELKAGFILAF
ncbi:MAG: porin family protein [bacterium]|nr:porin family protein [bacterium]